MRQHASDGICGEKGDLVAKKAVPPDRWGGGLRRSGQVRSGLGLGEGECEDEQQHDHHNGLTMKAEDRKVVW